MKEVPGKVTKADQSAKIETSLASIARKRSTLLMNVISCRARIRRLKNKKESN